MEDDQFALFGRDLFGDPIKPKFNTLATRFGVPPFSALDTRQQYWMERRRMWLALGFKSEEGREEGLAYNFSPKGSIGKDPYWGDRPNTSVFDPVLCECSYRWFSPENPDHGGPPRVLDPFCGGSVRGIVAALTGRDYIGFDLRPEQVAENQHQWLKMDQDAMGEASEPQWYAGDSTQLTRHLTYLGQGEPGRYDMIFSCPPYYDLETYSDDPADISNMTWEDFLVSYRRIIQQACYHLANDRFAVWVVSAVRDKKGLCRGFVSETVRAFADAGLALYNDAILLNSAGTAPVRATASLQATRKMTRVHQNVLVFYKGNPKAIKPNFGPVTMGG